MKTITTILLVLAILSLDAQEKFSIGLQVEGVRSTPKNLYSISTIESSFGYGVGIYVSHAILKSFSANTGLNYRFIQYSRFDKNVSYPTNYEPPFVGYKYNQNYLVVPLNLRKSFFNEMLFIETGLELNWILKRVDKKPKNEMLWKIGAGSKLGKLNYSLNYIWGNKEQSDLLISGSNVKFVTYTSRMIQLKVSYPLWQKK